MTKQSETQKNNNLYYKFFYWGPLLFRVKIRPPDLKKCLKLCSKKSSSFNDSLAGVIKQEHYVSPHSLVKIITNYLGPFQDAYTRWYGKPLTKRMELKMSWVNYMTAGEFNPPHIHPGSDFSSVLFLKIPPKLREEHKKFIGTGAGPGALSFIYGESQTYSLNSRYFFPEEGDLFIFPETLIHFVSPFMSKGERISISANFKLV